MPSTLQAVRCAILCAIIGNCAFAPAQAQLTSGKKTFNHQDSLRGTITPDRAWWDVTHYDVTVAPNYDRHFLKCKTTIRFTVLHPDHHLRVDLQQPLVVTQVLWNDTVIESHMREGDQLYIDFPRDLSAGSSGALTILCEGLVRVAKNPPWDGGWIFTSDSKGEPWMTAACQGIGASVWYPCKDHQSDEPDSAALHVIAPSALVGVGNGRLRSVTDNNDGTRTWNWAVTSPINSYNLVPSVGRYIELQDTYAASYGPLDLSYWVLEQDSARAYTQFQQVKPMLDCFERWFGPYPFAADGYKLVQAPFLGMEHQSAIAYGNDFMNGYRGMDLSGTGHGKKWDYIIVHESAHEWFGNSITTADIADMWVHEGFADYAETIYTQCLLGDEAGNDYVIGLRMNIQNDRPVIGPYGVNEEGSGDMYYKGANLLHTIRHIMGDDEAFHNLFLLMYKMFSHSIVTNAQVEALFNENCGIDLSKVFDQYLRTTMVPQLECKLAGKHLKYRWTNCVPGFNMPVKVTAGADSYTWVPTTDWTEAPETVGKKVKVEVDRNWYITYKGPR